MPLLSDCLTFCGLGLLAPAAFYIFLRWDWGASLSAAAALLLFFPGFYFLRAAIKKILPLPSPYPSPASGRGHNELSLLLAGLASMASTIVFLPNIGARLTIALGILLLAAGLWQNRNSTPQISGRLWLWGFFLAASVAWLRFLSLLFGNALYAWSCLLLSLACGAAIAEWLRLRKFGLGSPGAFAAAAGFIGLIVIHFLKFVGINAGDAAYLHLPIGSLGDIIFIAGQAVLALTAWAALISLAGCEPKYGENDSSWNLFTEPLAIGIIVWAIAAPLIAVKIIPWLGASGTAALFNWLLILYGLVTIGSPRITSHPIRDKAAVALLGCALALSVHRPMQDIWINRLNSAYPGGKFLTLSDDGAEYFGVYQFSSQARVFIRDGAVDFEPDDCAKREVHIPLLLADSPKKALLLGTRNPLSLSAALSHGVAVDFADPNPNIQNILEAQGWLMPKQGIRMLRTSQNRLLSRGSERYDAIVVDLPAPLYGPQSSFAATEEAFLRLRAHLTPGGAMAMRIPIPYFQTSFLRLAKTAQKVFPNAQILNMKGCLLLVAGASALNTDSAPMLQRLSQQMKDDDPDLQNALLSKLPWIALNEFAFPPAFKAQTDDQAKNAFPLGSILAQNPLEYVLAFPSAH